MGKDAKLDYGPHNCSLKGQWGKWKGVTCAGEGCTKQAIAKGFCASHYNKTKWASGYRPPSVNAVSHRNAHLKHRYGITIDDFNAIFEAQGGLCAICGNPPSDTTVPSHWKNKFAVDHCAKTGKVRGLLCNHCNIGIGHLKTESVALSAVRYLRLRDGEDSQR